MPSKIEKSHIELLKSITTIEDITNSNIENILKSLRTKKNKELSNNYKISILRTIKKYNKTITKTPTSLNLNTTRNSQPADVKVLENLLDIIKYVYNLNSATITLLANRSVIDSYIAILLITSCQITINDIYKLTKTHFNNLLKGETIVITKRATIIPKLFVEAEPIINELISHRATLFSDIVSQNDIISCSPDVINKTIKELFLEYSASQHKHKASTLGLYKFRFKNPDVIFSYIK
ncbi:VLF-1b [Penaeus vannamei nudivirus]|nr:VLF-1 [Penaeus vannamei nucleopolyhedrovirus]